VIAKLLGWSGLYRELRPNDALFWGSIRWSICHGFQHFDFEGVNPLGAKKVQKGESLPEELKHSPDFIKYGFGGDLILYPGAYDLVFNPIIRMVYDKIPLDVNGHTPFSKILDRIRKR
jgi:lipid II:glycine glycyltransferase (peptidoglycan interpeptide bridge formation enzyme)